MSMQANTTTKGLFLVDLRGLDLSDEQIKAINDAIQEIVQRTIAETSDLEGSSILALGPGIMGFFAA